MASGKIYVSDMGTVITPYQKGQCRELENETSIYNKVYHKRTPFAGFLLPYDGRGAFITHTIPTDKLQNLFPYYEIEKQREVNASPMSNLIDLVNIAEFKTAQTEVIEQIRDSKRKKRPWFVNLQTATGKTILSTFISTEFSTKTWVLCFSTDVLDQWKSTFVGKTNIDPARILKLDSSSVLKRLLSGKLNPRDYDVFLSTPGLLNSFAKSSGDYSLIYDIFNVCGIGLMIYDEAHRNLGNLIKIMACAKTKYQLFLSADFGQGDYKKEAMHKNIFSRVLLVSASELVTKSLMYTKIGVVEYNSKPKNEELMAIFDRFGYSETNFIRYEFQKGILQEALLHIMSQILKTDQSHRFLVLISTVDEVDEMTKEIASMISTDFPNLSVGAYHQNTPSDIKTWVKTDANIIVSTYKSFSTGIDVEDIKYVFSTNQCNKITDNQSAGRARPLKDGSLAMYLMFVDKGYDYCNRKLKTRIAYLMTTKSSEEKPFKYVYYPLDYTI